ncbi:MAG: ABC transporter permease [Candidatus Nanopelagicales bacterium]|nr:ABC transporter permease [Candidatus Nanopelagicales bacterium]
MSNQNTIQTGNEGSFLDAGRNYIARVKGGETGSLPALLGLMILATIFAVANPIFLKPINFANLLTQTATVTTLAMGLTFVLLLGEIDLAAGVTAGLSAAFLAISMSNYGVAWPLAVVIAISLGMLIGFLIGVLVAKVGIPSFVVTLAAFLAFQGLQLVVVGKGGLIGIDAPPILAIMNTPMPIAFGWILLAVIFVLYVGSTLYSRRQRTTSGQLNKPMGILVFRSLTILIVGAGFVSFLNLERGANPAVTSLKGVPYVVPIVLILLAAGTFVLNRTKFGRHVYAVGGNAEAARRAGIQVSRVRIKVFMISSSFAGIAGILMASRQASVDAAAGRSIVLNAIAAAVVGGVSLFGGRGRLSDAVIGGFVIAVIDNGLGLIGLASGLNLAITGGVLLLAATADAITSRKSRTS